MKDRQYENKWNNSICLNKSQNVSRYSIKIEAQSDLNKITILLNDNPNTANKLEQKHLSESECDLEDELDDVSEVGKYSQYYESSQKHINLSELPDIRRNYVDGCLIEGNTSVPN